MESQGNLSDNSVRSLLETAQGERATGILTVRDGGNSCTLYFLFGSLVHAEAGNQVGDDAVVSALGWKEGDFTFDSKAKLPADETVTGSLADLISAADAVARNGARPSEPVPAAAPPEPEPEPEPVAEVPAPEPVVLAPEPVVLAPEPEPEPEPAVEEPAAVPQARRGVKHRPEPKHGREPIPVPAGEVTYDSLKTSFVDFPRLITTLERDGYTGYVRLLTEEASGLIFFKDGAALECVYDAGEEVQFGKPALAEFNTQVMHGHGVLDVVGLTPDVVVGLHELTVARPLYTELYASWVDFANLLQFLADRGHSGSVTVRSNGKTGVIIFTDGSVTGAYTSETRDITNDVELVRTLCDDPKAMIEVKAAEPASHTPLDVDEVVGRRTPGGGAPASAPARPAPTSTQSLPTQPFVAPPEPEPEPEPPAASFPSSTAELPAQTFTAPEPEPAPPPEPPAPAGPPEPSVDWEGVINELQDMAEESLGNRSRKVKDILAAAEQSRSGVEKAIDEIPTISLLFVDSTRLEALAQDMRSRVQSKL